MRAEKDNIIVARSPVTDLKAIKNGIEIEGLFTTSVSVADEY